MFGKYVFAIYAICEVLLNIAFWGKSKTKLKIAEKVGIQSLLSTIIDWTMIAMCVIYW